jgi:predicted neutral ceramidase superfamily lipid hydrolase
MTTPNPYSTPHAPVDKPGPAPRSRLLLAISWAAVLLLTGLAVAAPRIIHTFMQVFTSTGVNLRPATLLVVATPYVWSAFPVAALLLAVDAQRRARHEVDYRRKAAMLIGMLLLLAFVSFGAAVTLLYQPVFDPGSPR